MPASHTIDLTTTTNPPVRGVWCAVCLLPSAVQVSGTLGTPGGSVVGAYGLTACTRCGESWPT